MRPWDAALCVETVKRFQGRVPLLGVCLGHQAIGEAFGGRVVHAPEIVHGKADKVFLAAVSPIFKNMPDGFEAARYHSLIVEPESLPDCLEVTAETVKHEIMALQHKTLPVYGVQFHPESIMTPEGRTILRNFLKL